MISSVSQDAKALHARIVLMIASVEKIQTLIPEETSLQTFLMHPVILDYWSGCGFPYQGIGLMYSKSCSLTSKMYL